LVHQNTSSTGLKKKEELGEPWDHESWEGPYIAKETNMPGLFIC
jgi:hypothetical protein